MIKKKSVTVSVEISMEGRRWVVVACTVGSSSRSILRESVEPTTATTG